jgi:biopolymer transport protein ExbB
MSNMGFLHDLSLWALYAALAVAIFFAIERAIFFFATRRDFAQARRLLAGPALPPASALRANGIPGQLVRAAEAEFGEGRSRAEIEDACERAYIRAQGRLNRHLWVFDTVVTAAPLLGLLGTILGIFETFTALAKSGISDPQGVSAGIGTALLATAVGIAVALLALLAYNVFLQQVEHLIDEVKLMLLELGRRRQAGRGAQQA